MRKRDQRRIADDEALDAVLSAGSMVSYDAKIAALVDDSSLCHLLGECLHLDGDFIECGVFRGHSLRQIVQVMSTASSAKTVYAADSYEGFPDAGITDNDTTLWRPKSRLRKKFRVAGDVPARLEALFRAKAVRGVIVRGYFEDTLPQLDLTRLCFIHLDSDSYSSHKFCLDLLYDRLVPGGVIVFDDYREPKWPGATKAIDEFFADREEEPMLCDARGDPAWFVRKPQP